MARDQRLDDEIQFHIDKQIEKNIRAGMSPDDARRDALLKFGGVERAREGARDEMRFAWFADFIRDLRISLRSLGRIPSFAAATILTFGLGLGAAVAMFSVVNGVLLKPLPYPQSDRIVRLYQLGQTNARVCRVNFADWRAAHDFTNMALLANFGRIRSRARRAADGHGPSVAEIFPGDGGAAGNRPRLRSGRISR